MAFSQLQDKSRGRSESEPAASTATCRDVCCSLPSDLEILSDSALETGRERTKKTRLDVPHG